MGVDHCYNSHTACCSFIVLIRDRNKSRRHRQAVQEAKGRVRRRSEALGRGARGAAEGEGGHSTPLRSPRRHAVRGGHDSVPLCSPGLRVDIQGSQIRHWVGEPFSKVSSRT